MLITVKANKIKIFGRKLGWCCGSLAESSDSKMPFPAGERVDIVFSSTDTLGISDVSVFAKEMAALLGKANGSRSQRIETWFVNLLSIGLFGLHVNIAKKPAISGARLFSTRLHITG